MAESMHSTHHTEGVVVRCDPHTHTLFSRHAYSTILENVHVAAERGLELLGSTDHYSSMLFPEQDLRNFQFFVNYGIWPREIEGVTLLHGCEADIVDMDGHLFGWDIPTARDITHHEIDPTRTLKSAVFSHCDYVVASVHARDFAEGCTPAAATAMYAAALDDPKVLAIGHPGRSGVKPEARALAREARARGKLIEINNHSFSYGVSAIYDACREIAVACAEEGTSVMVSTDAHFATQVGVFDDAVAMLDEIGFPPELVADRSAEAFLAAIAGAGIELEW